MGLISKIHSSAPYRVTILWMIYYPLVCVIFSAIFAAPIEFGNGASFKDAFLYEMSLFTGAIFPLTAYTPEGTDGQIVITNLLAVLHQIILSIFIGISAGPMIETLLEVDAGPLTRFDPDGTLLVPRTKLGMFLKIFFYYILILAISVFWSIWWGGFLALSEGWPFKDGFVTALGVITSGAFALNPTNAPVTVGGIFCGFYLGIMGAAMLGLTIAVASVPLLGFDLSYKDSPAVRVFPLLLLSVEQRNKLGLNGNKEEAIDKDLEN